MTTVKQLIEVLERLRVDYGNLPVSMQIEGELIQINETVFCDNVADKWIEIR